MIRKLFIALLVIAAPIAIAKIVENVEIEKVTVDYERGEKDRIKMLEELKTRLLTLSHLSREYFESVNDNNIDDQLKEVELNREKFKSNITLLENQKGKFIPNIEISKIGSVGALRVSITIKQIINDQECIVQIDQGIYPISGIYCHYDAIPYENAYYITGMKTGSFSDGKLIHLDDKLLFQIVESKSYKNVFGVNRTIPHLKVSKK